MAICSKMFMLVVLQKVTDDDRWKPGDVVELLEFLEVAILNCLMMAELEWLVW